MKREKFTNTTRFIFMLVVALSFNNCVEPYDYEVEDFDSALVVEATITDEVKTQQIKITRSYELDTTDPKPIVGANVRLVGDNGSSYIFKDDGAGNYLSSEDFGASQNINYTLEIQANGREYTSISTQLTPAAAIDDLYAERVEDDFGNDGVGIFVDSNTLVDEAYYFQYTFEETYKIQSPYRSDTDLEVVSLTFPYSVKKVDKVKEEYTCYNTLDSDRIILTSTQDLSSGNVQRAEVNFLDRLNPKISRRYSILVKQYVRTREAYEFYATLKDLSENESLFTQTQPGLLTGNIISKTNEDEPVLGYFNVSSASQKRIFFNYDDFYDFEDRPGDFIENCEPSAPAVESLVFLLDTGSAKYLKDNDNPQPFDGPYLVVPAACMDCTLLGTNVKPDFWID